MSSQIIEHDGKFYREVDRKAEVGDKVTYVYNGMRNGIVVTVTKINDDGWVFFDKSEWYETEDGGEVGGFGPNGYRVLEPIEPPTGPQTQHEAIANLALKVAKLIEKVDAQEAAIDEILSRLGHVEADLDESNSQHTAPMAELQLAILRADLPLDLRLDLIRESERLHNERLEKITQMRAMDE